MDVGNSSVRGFLPNKVAAKMGDTRLTVGMVLVCQVRGEEGTNKHKMVAEQKEKERRVLRQLHQLLL